MRHCDSSILGWICRGIFFSFLLYIGFFPGLVSATHTEHIFPKRANYYLKWDIAVSDAQALAQWDLLILDMETQVTSRPALEKIRQLNPDIILLAYITPQEIRTDAATSYSTLRRLLYAQLPESWYLTNSRGQRLTFWPGTHTLNISDICPIVNGRRVGQVMAEFVANNILSTGLWNGVFYDNAWDDPAYFVGADIDLDRNGAADSALAAHWQAGMKYLYRETRRLTGDRYLIVGNGTTRAYRDELNGNLIENFIGPAWGPTMRTFAYNQARSEQPAVNIINANTGNTGNQANYRQMRFGLASTLMEEGYYSFDDGDRNHTQLWWYDEYNSDLGPAVGDPVSKNHLAEYGPDLWRREFEHGMAVVNSSGERGKIGLGADYERLRGTQDAKANDGAIVSETVVDPYDGQIFLKVISALVDVLYPNGAFVRFFRPDGSRPRNGFFVFDQGIPGGEFIAHVDLDGNAIRDQFVGGTSRMTAARDDGQPLFRFFPYTANFRGTLSYDLGDINGDQKQDIIVAPSQGAAQPIKMYSPYGEQIGADWWPRGTRYAGGHDTAVCTVDGGKTRLVALGTGRGQEPLVSLYRADTRALLRSWLAFERAFRGGISVACGDVDGDGTDEILVGAGAGKKPIVKIFTSAGKEKFPAFTAFQTLGTPGVGRIESADVNFDGKDEIVLLGDAAP